MSLPVPGANRSIEISSPRLHCGRAAVYRSTMIPLMPHRVIQVPPVYQCSLFCFLCRRIAATHQRDVLGLTIRFSSYLKIPFIIIKAQEDTHFSRFSKKFFHDSYSFPEFLIYWFQPVCQAKPQIKKCQSAQVCELTLWNTWYSGHLVFDLETIYLNYSTGSFERQEGISSFFNPAYFQRFLEPLACLLDVLNDGIRYKTITG